jgi:hypothetical protein
MSPLMVLAYTVEIVATGQPSRVDATTANGSASKNARCWSGIRGRIAPPWAPPPARACAASSPR